MSRRPQCGHVSESVPGVVLVITAFRMLTAAGVRLGIATEEVNLTTNVQR